MTILAAISRANRAVVVLDKVASREYFSIGFKDLCFLLTAFGFQERVRGDHHIFTRTGVIEIINLQAAGSKAKPY